MCLRRAISSCYYALFHCLARECADSLIGGTGAARSDKAWKQVYRALEHNYVSNQVRNKDIIKRFPKEIEDFANTFVGLQKKRHDADYDPYAKFTKSEVETDIITTTQAVATFKSASVKDRRAFCAYVLLKSR